MVISGPPDLSVTNSPSSNFVPNSIGLFCTKVPYVQGAAADLHHTGWCLLSDGAPAMGFGVCLYARGACALVDHKHPWT